MKKMILLFLISSISCFGSEKIQHKDVDNYARIIGIGGIGPQLPWTDQIWDTFNNQQLSTTISLLGSPTYAIKIKTANYTLLTTDSVILADSSSGPITLTLPLSSSFVSTQTKAYFIADISTNSNLITITRSGGDNIIGEVSQYMNTPGSGLILIPDGGTRYVGF